MRLRKRMEHEGWDALRPHEMVELVLFHAVPRRDVSDVSRLLVDRFGTVGGVFGASKEQLLEVPGVTASMAEWIGLTSELIRAYRDLYYQKDICLSCYQEVVDFLESRRGMAQGARMWILYADFDFNLITFEDQWKSETWWDAANARKILTKAIGNGARYIYMVLWMGSEPLEMSEEDIVRLEFIATTMRAVELDLVDCLLAGDDGFFSMNLNGKMKRIRAESGCMELHERYGIEPDALP